MLVRFLQDSWQHWCTLLLLLLFVLEGLVFRFLDLGLLNFRLELLEKGLEGGDVCDVCEVKRVDGLLLSDEALGHQVELGRQVFVTFDYKPCIFL